MAKSQDECVVAQTIINLKDYKYSCLVNTALLGKKVTEQTCMERTKSSGEGMVWICDRNSGF